MFEYSASIQLLVIVAIAFLGGAAVGALILHTFTHRAKGKKPVSPRVGVVNPQSQDRGPEPKRSVPAVSEGAKRNPQPAKPQVDVTFHLSDLKTQIPCGPLDQCADPMALGNYERCEKFFMDRKISTLLLNSETQVKEMDSIWINPAMQVVPGFGDHMRSPLRKPTGNVIHDEQTAIREIMRYLWGNRNCLVRTGQEMAPLDFQSSVRVTIGWLKYAYDSYTAWDSGCYDSGTFEPGGHYTAERFITVYLASEDSYMRERERARSKGEAYTDIRRIFAYDGTLAFEDETEAFIRDSWHDHTLYLYKPFGMKNCLRINVRDTE